MAITLDSFTKLFGKVNDGQFALKGTGDNAHIERLNRGSGTFTRTFIYKQQKLDAQTNLNTRRVLCDALMSAASARTSNAKVLGNYMKEVRRALGIGRRDEEMNTKPLDCREVKRLIDENKETKFEELGKISYGQNELEGLTDKVCSNACRILRDMKFQTGNYQEARIFANRGSSQPVSKEHFMKSMPNLFHQIQKIVDHHTNHLSARDQDQKVDDHIVRKFEAIAKGNIMTDIKKLIESKIGEFKEMEDIPGFRLDLEKRMSTFDSLFSE